MQAIVTKIKDIVVTPCLDENESYAIRSRKLAVIAIAVIVSNAFVLGVPATVVSGLYDPTWSAYRRRRLCPSLHHHLHHPLFLPPLYKEAARSFSRFPNMVVFVDLFIH